MSLKIIIRWLHVYGEICVMGWKILRLGVRLKYSSGVSSRVVHHSTCCQTRDWYVVPQSLCTSQ